MNLSKTNSILFIPAVGLLLLGGFVVCVRAEPVEPMPPVPWSMAEPISPLVSDESSEQERDEDRSVNDAFKLPSTKLPSKTKIASKEAKNDIADKLAKATTEQSTAASRPYAPGNNTANNGASSNGASSPTVAQLERIAVEAKSAHALGRLITRCQKALTADLTGEALSEEDRKTINRITGWAYAARGQIQYQEGHAEKAIRDFTTALVFDPYQTGAYFNRGTLLAEIATKPAMQKALADFNQVLEMEPEHLLALRNRAILHLELNEPRKSLRDSRRGILVWSKQTVRSSDLIVSLYELSGSALQRLNRLEQAIEAYDLALHYDSESSTVRLRRGALLASQGEYQSAIDDLLVSLNSPRVTNTESAEAYRCLSWLLATCPEAKYRDAAKAVEAANRAMRLSDTKGPKLLETLAVAHASAGDFTQAIKYQQKVVLTTTVSSERKVAEQRLAQFEHGILIELPKRVASENLRHATYNKSSVK